MGIAMARLLGDIDNAPCDVAGELRELAGGDELIERETVPIAARGPWSDGMLAPVPMAA